ncbi:MAG: electron transfer flavoprotein subunit alpha/FixB family protein [Bacteroidales bacterium]|nr:electron transfer flavoprotein subunit alpha/FixB family protein [Bacteroidales bacterium]MCF8397156.1 electron transfer flavoprotein subunit alpha/FixB family protein [Bacteroidales bacterium]
MSVLVYTENWDGKFKKLSFELVSYAKAIADQLNTEAVAVSIGNVEEDELKKLGNYGAKKIFNVQDEKLKNLANQPYAKIIAQVAEKEDANVLVFANNFTGKAVAPRVSVKLKAGLAGGVIELPSSLDPFMVKRKVFTNKAFANIKIKSEKKVLTLFQNSFEIKETENAASIENFTPEFSDADFRTEVKEVNKVTGKILLTDAEIVVSGGRGMKSPEKWEPLEELAEVLGGATACSRPVSDEGWRPHEEHVGQTGKIIAPNLYIALGISGAIQHLGGVSSSKIIVAVNTDKDAPIFEAADYGIVGDVHKILPQFIEAVKEVKAEG